MSQLFSKKNKEVFSAPISMNNPVTVQVLGICSAWLLRQIGAGYRDGFIGNSDRGICQCDYFIVAQHHTEPYSYHCSAGGCGCAGYYR